MKFDPFRCARGVALEANCPLAINSAPQALVLAAFFGQSLLASLLVSLPASVSPLAQAYRHVPAARVRRIRAGRRLAGLKFR